MEKKDRERILTSIKNMKNTNWYNAGKDSDEETPEYREYLARKETLDRVHNIIIKESSRKESLKRLDCKYWKEKDGYVSGCGCRVAYNKFWHICPICGKAIVVVNQSALED